MEYLTSLGCSDFSERRIRTHERSHPKPSSFATGKTLTTFYAEMLVTGNPSSALMVNHPLSTKVPFTDATDGPPLQPSNSPSTMPLRQHTRIFSGPTQVTTPSVQSTPITSLRHHRSQNNNDSIASCTTSMIPTLTDPLPSHLHPTPHEHHSHDLSGLAREAFNSGLVRVAHSGGTQQTMSCSDALPSPHLAAGSLEPTPLTLTSSACLMAASNLAISNAPPIVSFALCPPVRTHLDW